MTPYIDTAQIVLYAFFAFFAGLMVYLRREDKREGYPLVNTSPGGGTKQGFPNLPKPKSFLLSNGETVLAPRMDIDARQIMATPVAPYAGSPLEPTGNPLIDGVGPAAYALRGNFPDTTVEGHARIVPLRVALTHSLETRDPDPRGMDVVGADGMVAGKITDAWVDRAECIIRYLEVEVATGGPTARHVLLPINFTRIDGKRRTVRVKSILAKQFADVPTLASADSVTRREEDRICAYYGGGYLYATPARQEPLI